MRSVKKQDKKNESDRLADLAKALSHPARIKILELLNRRNSCICNELVEELPLAQSTVSQHLKELKRAGLIMGEIDGPRTCYCLNPDGIAEMKRLFHNYMHTLKGSEL